MRLYITEMEVSLGDVLMVWHGTKGAAMSHSRRNASKWSSVEVPTRKAELLAFLNKLSGNGADNVQTPKATPPSKGPIRRGARK